MQEIQISKDVVKCFDRPVSSENIFILVTNLDSSSPTEVDFIFRCFVENLAKVQKNSVKSPEMLASWGIYLSIILRYDPNTNIYVNGEHFLLIGFKAYSPYISLYITYFIIVSVIRKTDLGLPYSDNDSEKGSPKEGSPKQFANISANRDAHKIIAKKVNGVMTANSKTPKISEDKSIINHLIELCPKESPERKLLIELKKVYTSSPNFFIIRVGLKTQKQEMAIFLDMPDLLEDKLSTDDIMKAIYTHSNNILRYVTDFNSEHFERSIDCLNLKIAKKTSEDSDWVSPEIFNKLIYNCKEIRHAKCLEILLLAVTKNVTICKHHMKRLPEDWRSKVMEIYTTPRWKSSSSKIIKEGKETYKICKATNVYYLTNLCSTNTETLYENLEELSEKLKDDEVKIAFLNNIKTMNKTYFILKTAGYEDFLSGKLTSFANTEDFVSNDIFEISRNFIIAFREDDKIYMFSYDSFPTLISKKINPYNRQPIPEFVLKQIVEIYDRMNGLRPSCCTMSEFIQEMVSGRSIVSDCNCAKNYRKKLIRILRHYNIKEESIDWINLDDILMKFGLISLDFQAETLDQLCEKLYRAIKNADENSKEQLRETIASIILIYSRSGGGFVINI